MFVLCEYNIIWAYIGTKNVAKSVKKVAQGGVRSEGKTWFAELSDKSEW